MFWFIRIGKSHSFRDSVFWILFFLNRNRNSQDSPKIMRLSLFFHLCTHLSRVRQVQTLIDVFAFKISNSKTFFLKLVQANLLSYYRIRPSKKAELSIMSYIFHQSQCVGTTVCPDCCMNALFLIVRSERDLSAKSLAAILVAKFTCI